MLYITTRGNKDTFTSHKAFYEDFAPDGGRFVPFRMPSFERQEILELKDKTFGQIVAQILNVFFSCQLTGWDVDFTIGRAVFRTAMMNHRIAVAELWHNPSVNYTYIVNSLYKRISNDEAASPTDWFRIAVRIAVLFGLYGEMLKEQAISDDQYMDVSIPVDDFSAPMAAWYARSMGLPIGTIICTCEENSPIWDLIHRGVFNTAVAGEELLLGVERLIEAAFGCNTVANYRKMCSNKQAFAIDEELAQILKTNLFCAVTGHTRAATTINSVFRSNSYIMEPLTALCYGGLQDYRARTGGARATLLLSERSPLDYINEISAATGISAKKLINHVKQT